MRCEIAIPLIPRFVDDELGSAEAAPLRQHFVDCHACRVRVQEARALSSWFVDPEPIVGSSVAPDGFAAQVTALAFDRGGDAGTLTPVLSKAANRGPRPLEVALAEAQADRATEDRTDLQSVKGFVLNAVAAAAMVILFLSVAIKSRGLPDVEQLSADSQTLSRTLEMLDELNAQELAGPADAGADSGSDSNDEETLAPKQR